MQIRRIKGKFWAAWQILCSRMLPSFSQAGEDRIIHYLLSHYLGIEKPTYLDIGANHPILYNNTYLFYLRGGHGVCVEPDPKYYKLLKKYRSKDVILQAGIGTGIVQNADFYEFPGKEAAWNTFSKEEAQRRKDDSGIRYTVRQRTLLDINETIAKWFGSSPDIVSIDAEGVDIDILRSLDLDKYQPRVICVESVGFTVTGNPVQNREISEYAKSKGYFIYADTHINTIFCRRDLFPQQQV